MNSSGFELGRDRQIYTHACVCVLDVCVCVSVYRYMCMWDRME